MHGGMPVGGGLWGCIAVERGCRVEDGKARVDMCAGEGCEWWFHGEWVRRARVSLVVAAMFAGEAAIIHLFMKHYE